MKISRLKDFAVGKMLQLYLHNMSKVSLTRRQHMLLSLCLAAIKTAQRCCLFRRKLITDVCRKNTIKHLFFSRPLHGSSQGYDSNFIQLLKFHGTDDVQMTERIERKNPRRETIFQEV